MAEAEERTYVQCKKCGRGVWSNHVTKKSGYCAFCSPALARAERGEVVDDDEDDDDDKPSVIETTNLDKAAIAVDPKTGEQKYPGKD